MLDQPRGISGLGVSRGWSINTGTASQHAQAQGTHMLAESLGAYGGALYLTSLKRVQADLGFLCDLGFLHIQEMWLQKSHRRSHVPHE